MPKKAQRPRQRANARANFRRGTERQHASRANHAKPQAATASHAVGDAPVISTPPPFAIVGIGASAGGLEACSDLLRALSPHAAFAIVIVQHLSPEHESFLPSLLAGVTNLPVVQVRDGMSINEGH